MHVAGRGLGDHQLFLVRVQVPQPYGLIRFCHPKLAPLAFYGLLFTIVIVRVVNVLRGPANPALTRTREG